MGPVGSGGGLELTVLFPLVLLLLGMGVGFFVGTGEVACLMITMFADCFSSILPRLGGEATVLVLLLLLLLLLLVELLLLALLLVLFVVVFVVEVFVLVVEVFVFVLDVIGVLLLEGVLPVAFS